MCELIRKSEIIKLVKSANLADLAYHFINCPIRGIINIFKIEIQLKKHIFSIIIVTASYFKDGELF